MKTICTKYDSNISTSWAFCQTLFHQNPESENEPNFNDIKLSQYTVAGNNIGLLLFVADHMTCDVII